MSAALLVPALLLDAALGEPDWLWKRWPHPAVLMGRVVGWCDARLNQGRARRAKGVLAMALMGSGALILGALIAAVPDYGLLEVIVAAILLAQRSLVNHVRAVGNALRLSLGDGRLTVGWIVGRDTAAMDEPAVARAAIESAAENLSDGIVAPALWFLAFGLPGLMLYKITNRVRLGGGAARRRAELDPGAGDGGADRAEPWRDRCPPHLARRAAAPLAQRRLARGGDGGGAGRRAVGAAQLSRAAAGVSLGEPRGPPRRRACRCRRGLRGLVAGLGRAPAAGRGGRACLSGASSPR